MRSFGMLLAGTTAALLAGAAPAQMAGAPMGAPTQPGAWGQGGWHAGAAGPQGYYGPAQQGYAYGEAQRRQAWHDSPRGDYHRAERGHRMPRPYLDRSYAVNDWQAWGLGQPGPGMHWLRYYDDAVMVDADGRVVDMRNDFGWDRPHGGYAGGPGFGYAPGPGYDAPPPGYGAPGYGGPGYAPGVHSYRAGPNTTVTTAVVAAPPPVVVGGPASGYAYGGGYYAGGGSVVTVTPGVVVTTTTTSTDYETVYKSVAARRVYHRRVYRPIRPRCVRAPTCPVLGS